MIIGYAHILSIETHSLGEWVKRSFCLPSRHGKQKLYPLGLAILQSHIIQIQCDKHSKNTNTLVTIHKGVVTYKCI